MITIMQGWFDPAAETIGGLECELGTRLALHDVPAGYVVAVLGAVLPGWHDVSPNFGFHEAATLAAAWERDFPGIAPCACYRTCTTEAEAARLAAEADRDADPSVAPRAGTYEAAAAAVAAGYALDYDVMPAAIDPLAWRREVARARRAGRGVY